MTDQEFKDYMLRVSTSTLKMQKQQMQRLEVPVAPVKVPVAPEICEFDLGVIKHFRSLFEKRVGWKCILEDREILDILEVHFGGAAYYDDERDVSGIVMVMKMYQEAEA
jgi:hypothetical protein